MYAQQKIFCEGTLNDMMDAVPGIKDAQERSEIPVMLITRFKTCFSSVDGAVSRVLFSCFWKCEDNSSLKSYL